MRYPYDSLDLDSLRRCSQQHAEKLWDHHKGLCQLLSILGLQFAGHLVPRPQNPPPLYRESLLRAPGWCRLLHLGDCQGSRNRTHCAPASHKVWRCSRMGYGARDHVFNRQLRNAHRKPLFIASLLLSKSYWSCDASTGSHTLETYCATQKLPLQEAADSVNSIGQ